ncbi:MAG: HRDC domain-containing protein [Pirellulaceae bacterium]
MALRFFIVPAQSSTAAEAELNAFLSSHQVLNVDRRWVDLGANSFWALCVDYITGGKVDGGRSFTGSRARIDYKQVLAPDEFAVFSKLREVRKEIAQLEAVPACTIFTNEQLAQIVQQRCRTTADLARIEGIGEARIEKYAERLLPFLSALSESRDAPSREPV